MATTRASTRSRCSGAPRDLADEVLYEEERAADGDRGASPSRSVPNREVAGPPLRIDPAIRPAALGLPRLWQSRERDQARLEAIPRARQNVGHRRHALRHDLVTARSALGGNPVRE